MALRRSMMRPGSGAVMFRVVLGAYRNSYRVIVLIEWTEDR
jgi:hypothetical protein